MEGFWLGLLYTAMWIGVFVAIGGGFGLLYFIVRRSQRIAAESGGTAGGSPHARQERQAPPERREERVRELPPATPQPSEVAAPQPRHPQALRSAERRHLMIVGAPGDGKTQTQIAFLVGDIANGDQVLWASTNLSLYHSRDQRTDLRPIAELFEHTRDLVEIMAALLWASAEVDRRMPFYHADQPHGEPVNIYIDELGGLYRAFGDTLVAAMRNIGEQGRKVDVFLAVAAHNTLKEATGLDMALKPLFQTRLLGNVDQATWTAMVGPGQRLRGVPDGQGLWNMPDRRGNIFEVTIHRPTAQDIARLATRRPRGHPSILLAAQPYREELARGKPAAAGAQLAPHAAPWEPTDLHLQVRRLITEAIPSIASLLADGQTLAKAQEMTQTSNRALARRLGLGANGGTAAVRVSEMIKEWETQGGVTLFDVPELAPNSRSERSERAERPERPERLEQPEGITPAA